MRVLVLQHIACEPPGAYEDVPRGACLGIQLLAASLVGRVYPHQAFRFERAYGVQFHLEVSLEKARASSEVPAYADYGRWMDTTIGART